MSIGAMPCSRERLHVVGLAAHGQDAAGDLGMHGLDAAVEHFGKAGDFRDVAHRHAGFAQQPGGAAGRDQLRRRDRAQVAGEVDDAGFVGDADQGAVRFWASKLS